MSGYANRGGKPFARNLSATTAGVISVTGVSGTTQAAGVPYGLPSPTSWLRVTTATNGLRVYWHQADFDADRNYVSLAAGAAFEGPLEATQVWLRGVGGTAVVELLGASKTG